MKRHIDQWGFLEQYQPEYDVFEDVFCWRNDHRKCSDDCVAFSVEKCHAHCSALPFNRTDIGELLPEDEVK